MSSPKYNNDKSLLSSFEILKHCQERLGLAYQIFLKKDEETAQAMIAGIFVLHNEELNGLSEYLRPGTPEYLSALNQYTQNILDGFRKESKKN